MREAKKHRIIALQLSFTIIYHCRDSPTHVHYGYPFAPSTSEYDYFGLKIWFEKSGNFVTKFISY